jgi:ribonuclease P protein component
MAAQRPSLRLPQSMRLKQRRDFTALKQQGQRLAAGCLIANWTTSPAGSDSRLGVITSRKLGSAVTRSRARRLLRETFRLHQHDLRQPVRMVLVARSSILGKQRAEVERDFLSALRKAKLLKQP